MFNLGGKSKKIGIMKKIIGSYLAVLSLMLFIHKEVVANCIANITTSQSTASPNVMIFSLNSFSSCTGSNHSIVVNWGDGSSNFFSNVGPGFNFQKTYYQQGQFNGWVLVANNDSLKQKRFFSFRNNGSTDGTCCKDELVVPGLGTQPLSATGKFKVDELSGNIVFESSQCPIYSPYSCLAASPRIPEMEDVVSANATILDDRWTYFSPAYSQGSVNTALAQPNDYELGIKNKWRPKETYIYREEIDQTLISTTQNYEYKNFDRGTFGYVPFNWERPGFNDPEKWVKTNQINVYSPNGHVLEDENIMGVKSTALYGYNNTLQTAVAQNASYRGIIFESFENVYDVPNETYKVHDNFVLYDEDMGTRVQTESHTGKYSMQLFNPITAGNKGWSIFEIGSIKTGGEVLTPEYLEHGAIGRVWIKETSTTINFWETYSRFYIINEFTSPKRSVATRFKLKARCGEWELYEAYISPAQIATAFLSAGDPVRFSMYFEFNQTTPKYFLDNELFIDDVKVQPASSSMVCYVYDEAQRLVANFDDQHYALIYQYNEEGELIRKLKETKEGVRTITETRYNSKGTNNWAP